MNVTTVRAIVIVMVATVAAIVSLAIFVPGDNTVVVLQIVGVVAPTTAALLALLKSAENTIKTEATQEQVQRLSVTVDGRLTQLLEARSDASHAAGVHQGEQDERDRSTLAGPTTIAAEGPTTISTEGPVTVVGKHDADKR